MSSSSDLAAMKLKAGSGIKLDKSGERPAELAAELILKSVGEDLGRNGLRRTPERFAKAMREVCVGYTMSLAEVVGKGVFPTEDQGLVSVKNVEFYSMCEHHMLPFYGKVSVAYYPDQSILGLSKVPRIVEMFARRFQVQERLTLQILQALQETLAPRAVVVKVTGSHLCMMMRGVEKLASETTTESASGLESLSDTEKSRLFANLD